MVLGFGFASKKFWYDRGRRVLFEYFLKKELYAEEISVFVARFFIEIIFLSWL